MSYRPLFEEIRIALEDGLGVLETQMAALERSDVGRLKSGQRRYVRAVLDELARRIVVWEELAEAEHRARLDAIRAGAGAIDTPSELLTRSRIVRGPARPQTEEC